MALSPDPELNESESEHGNFLRFGVGRRIPVMCLWSSKLSLIDAWKLIPRIETLRVRYKASAACETQEEIRVAARGLNIEVDTDMVWPLKRGTKRHVFDRKQSQTPKASNL